MVHVVQPGGTDFKTIVSKSVNHGLLTRDFATLFTLSDATTQAEVMSLNNEERGRLTGGRTPSVRVWHVCLACGATHALAPAARAQFAHSALPCRH